MWGDNKSIREMLAHIDRSVSNGLPELKIGFYTRLLFIVPARPRLERVFTFERLAVSPVSPCSLARRSAVRLCHSQALVCDVEKDPGGEDCTNPLQASLRELGVGREFCATLGCDGS